MPPFTFSVLPFTFHSNLRGNWISPGSRREPIPHWQINDRRSGLNRQQRWSFRSTGPSAFPSPRSFPPWLPSCPQARSAPHKEKYHPAPPSSGSYAVCRLPSSFGCRAPLNRRPPAPACEPAPRASPSKNMAVTAPHPGPRRPPSCAREDAKKTHSASAVSHPPPRTQWVQFTPRAPPSRSPPSS